MAEHDGCRIKEFARWNRVLLQHEREHISRAMAGRVFKRQEEIDGLMHDLTDLDYLLSYHDVHVPVDSPHGVSAGKEAEAERD